MTQPHPHPRQDLPLDSDAARQLAHNDQTPSLQTVKEYVPIVKTVINRLGGYLPPDVPETTLIGKGILALMEAAQDHAPDSPDFEQTAQAYVWQALAETLSQSQCFTAESSQALHTLEEVCQRLTASGSTIDDESLAQALEVSVGQIRDYLAKISTLLAALPAQVLPIGSIADPVDPPQILPHGWQHQVARAIARLPQSEQLVVALYYFEQLSFPEIAEVLEMPLPQVQQLFGRAGVLLRVHLVRQMARAA